MADLATGESLIQRDVSQRGFTDRLWSFVYAGSGPKEGKVLLIERVSEGRFVFFEVDVQQVKDQILRGGENTIAGMIGELRPVFIEFPSVRETEIIRKCMQEFLNIRSGRFIGLFLNPCFPVGENRGELERKIHVLENLLFHYETGENMKTTPDTGNVLRYDGHSSLVTTVCPVHSIPPKRCEVDWFVVHGKLFGLETSRVDCNYQTWNALFPAYNTKVFGLRFNVQGQARIISMDAIYNIHIPTQVSSPERDTCYVRVPMQMLSGRILQTLRKFDRFMIQDDSKNERLMKLVVGLLPYSDSPTGDRLIYGDVKWFTGGEVENFIFQYALFLFKRYLTVTETETCFEFTDGTFSGSWKFQEESRVLLSVTENSRAGESDTDRDD